MKRPRLPRLPRRKPKAQAAPTGAAPAGPAGEAPTGEQPTAGHGLDGIRAWLAQIDRRLALRSYIGAAVAIVALAAGAAGIYLALETRDDAATKGDLNDVRTKITSVEQSALQAAAEDVEGLSKRIETIEGRIRSQGSASKRNRSEIKVANDDIEDLRDEIADLSSQVSDLETEVNSGSSGGGGGN